MNLYRYLSHKKLLDLVKTSELYFSSVASNEKSDNPEGHIPEIDKMLANGDAEFLDLAVQSLPSVDGSASQHTETKSEQIEQDIMSGTYKIFGAEYQRNEVPVEAALEEYKKHVYISCWTKSLDEEDHMWSYFSQDEHGNKNAVRIKTTKKRLIDAIASNDDFIINKKSITYLDFDNEASIPNGKEINPSFIKPNVYKGVATPFEKEDEFRVTAMSTDKTKIGKPAQKSVRLAVDLAKLIEEIFISPNAEPTYEQEVIQLIENRGLSRDIVVKK